MVPNIAERVHSNKYYNKIRKMEKKHEMKQITDKTLVLWKGSGRISARFRDKVKFLFTNEMDFSQITLMVEEGIEFKTLNWDKKGK